MNFTHEDRLVQQVRDQLKHAGETVWQRHPLPWTHPSFKSATRAAHNILHLYPEARRVLVMRDACLRPMRQLVLDAGRTLLIPTRHGGPLLRIPAPPSPAGLRPVLKIDPPPPGSAPYTGQVDLIIVGCLAFNPRRGLYSFEMESTAYALDNLYDRIGQAPLICMASDAQQVTDWPNSALAQYRADAVVSAARAVVLGSGLERRFNQAIPAPAAKAPSLPPVVAPPETADTSP